MNSYVDFLKKKIKMAEFRGFDVDLSEINPILKDHQKAIVQWAVKGGCRAIFAAFGLGKSVMQVEVLRLICKKAGGKVLIRNSGRIQEDCELKWLKHEICTSSKMGAHSRRIVHRRSCSADRLLRN